MGLGKVFWSCGTGPGVSMAGVLCLDFWRLDGRLGASRRRGKRRLPSHREYPGITY